METTPTKLNTEQKIQRLFEYLDCVRHDAPSNSIDPYQVSSDGGYSFQDLRDVKAAMVAKDAAIAELNQRLIERQESFQAQLVRIEGAWREKLRDVEVYRDKYHNGCERLSAALSRIDYAVGEPNEKEVSTFDVDCNEERVVEAVGRKIEEFSSKLSLALNLACKSDEDYDSEVDAKLWNELNDYQKALTSAHTTPESKLLTHHNL